MNNINIREVKNGDEKILAYIQTQSWKKAFSNILSEEDMVKYTNIEKTEEMYSYLLNNNIANGYILYVNDEPHCIAYWDKSREEDLNDYAELICIHSLQDNWGKGYGSIMMEHVLNEIYKSGFKKIMLWVFEENIRARRFYEKHGFILTDKTHKFENALEVMYVKTIGDRK